MTLESSENVLDAFVREFAEPMMRDLGQEARQPIDVVVLRFEGDKTIQRQQFTVPCNSPNATMAMGELRVLFRVSNGEGSFIAQAVFKELAPETGFSGFAVRGKIRSNNETKQVRVTARTNRYNDWEWDREFRR